MSIHFICMGNVFRSLIAETYIRSLGLSGVDAISSGVKVDMNDPQEREYFANTIAVLTRYGLESFAKDVSDQLTQSRIDGQSVTVCLNERVVDEARKIVTLPHDILNWNVIDIGEGHRTEIGSRADYEEEIFNEITANVDSLVLELGLK